MKRALDGILWFWYLAILLNFKEFCNFEKMRRSLRECHKAMTKWRGMKTLFISTVLIWTRLEAGVWPEAKLEPSP